MPRIIQITRRIIFVIAICVCLSQFSTSYAQQQSDRKDSTNLSSTSKQPVTLADSFAFPYLSYRSSEPLLLLLSGIAILIGARTVKRAAKRKRSSLR